MDFSLSDVQQQIRDEILRLCTRFDEGYWLRHENEATFPTAFYDAMAAGNWLGIAMPEAYGGAGLGISEAAVMAQAVAESGAAMSGASAIHMNIFGLNPVVVYGTEEQKRRMLPPIIQGKDKTCFGVTEPNAGLNTTEITTRAERHGDHYRINGTKIWTSTAQVANKILLLARTTPLDKVKRKSHGMTLFYTDLDRSAAEVRLIHKMGRHAVDSNMVFFEDMRVPVENRIGEEGEGFKALLHGLNPERVLIAAEAIGIGRAALARATRYARERVVFNRPIGQNQGVQHPLAKNWAELEAANLVMMKAAWLYDNGQECGAEANAAKYLGAEAGFRAAEQAVMTHGGMGYAQEYHVERLFRESVLPRLAPVSRELVLCYIAERVLDLPKSY
ncbi:acyl-CoA dehydrogenase family protein [Rhodopila sp.]|jgi:acyl-CoA dehydrogenase|uniref:acyl-CoA dehydrogenase family protein n=1 Tax=Rhodopila sp. TaxID=2480087 RepID=UPI002CC60D6F|nr:acyl-CoA dehydrogenase family protein [Rhodopila sp.]HVZ07134.1 acyl-CoA dehydrogenase family protein [Rhodopila sp.]